MCTIQIAKQTEMFLDIENLKCNNILHDKKKHPNNQEKLFSILRWTTTIRFWVWKCWFKTPIQNRCNSYCKVLKYYHLKMKMKTIIWVLHESWWYRYYFKRLCKGCAMDLHKFQQFISVIQVVGDTPLCEMLKYDYLPSNISFRKDDVRIYLE